MVILLKFRFMLWLVMGCMMWVVLLIRVMCVVIIVCGLIRCSGKVLVILGCSGVSVFSIGLVYWVRCLVRVGNGSCSN